MNDESIEFIINKSSMSTHFGYRDRISADNQIFVKSADDAATARRRCH